MSSTETSTKTVFSTTQNQPTNLNQNSAQPNQKTTAVKNRNLYQQKPPKKPTPRNLYPSKSNQVNEVIEPGNTISVELSDTEESQSHEERFPLERETEKFDGDVREMIEERKERKLGPPGNKPNFNRNSSRPKDWNKNKKNDKSTKKFKGSPSKQRRAVNFIPVATERRKNRIEVLEYQLAKAKEAIRTLSTRNLELHRQLQMQQQQTLNLGGQMFYQNPVVMMPMQMQQQPQMVFNQAGSHTNYMPLVLQSDHEIDAFLQS